MLSKGRKKFVIYAVSPQYWFCRKLRNFSANSKFKVFQNWKKCLLQLWDDGVCKTSLATTNLTSECYVCTLLSIPTSWTKYISKRLFSSKMASFSKIEKLRWKFGISHIALISIILKPIISPSSSGIFPCRTSP